MLRVEILRELLFIKLNLSIGVCRYLPFRAIEPGETGTSVFLPVRSRRNTGPAAKCTTEPARARKSGAAGDLCDLGSAVVEQPLREFEAHVIDQVRVRRGRFPESALQRSPAGADRGCDRFEGRVAVRQSLADSASQRLYRDLACFVCGFEHRDSFAWFDATGFQRTLSVGSGLRACLIAPAAEQRQGWGACEFLMGMLGAE